MEVARSPKSRLPYSLPFTRVLAVVLLVSGLTYSWLTRPHAEVADQMQTSARVGAVAPDMVLPLLDGEIQKLSELRGNVVVLNFWASWCGPCRAEMPALQAVQQDYARKGVVVMGVNQQEDAQTVAGFMNSVGASFPTMLDLDASVTHTYRVTGLPTTYFIGRDGVIRDAVFGGPMARGLIASKVESLLRAGD